MASVPNLSIDPITFVAGDDFSSCPTTQYRFVRAGSVANEVRLGNGASNPVALGILQTSPSTGQEAVVTIFGTSKLAVRAGTCNLAFGKLIQAASDGFGEAFSTAGCIPYCAMWLGGAVTTGSAIGAVMFYGLPAASGVSAS